MADFLGSLQMPSAFRYSPNSPWISLISLYCLLGCVVAIPSNQVSTHYIINQNQIIEKNFSANVYFTDR